MPSRIDHIRNYSVPTSPASSTGGSDPGVSLCDVLKCFAINVRDHKYAKSTALCWLVAIFLTVLWMACPLPELVCILLWCVAFCAYTSGGAIGGVVLADAAVATSDTLFPDELTVSVSSCLPAQGPSAGDWQDESTSRRESELDPDADDYIVHNGVDEYDRG